MWIEKSYDKPMSPNVQKILLLKDTLDMAYEITKLIKKSPKREAEFHRKQATFVGQMERDFHII